MSHHSTLGNKLANWVVKEAAKQQPKPLEPTPASDLIDTRKIFLPQLEYILNKPTRKQQSSTNQTSAMPLEAINTNLQEPRNIPLQATAWSYISYTCASSHKSTSPCLSPLWKAYCSQIRANRVHLPRPSQAEITVPKILQGHLSSNSHGQNPEIHQLHQLQPLNILSCLQPSC